MNIYMCIMFVMGIDASWKICRIGFRVYVFILLNVAVYLPTMPVITYVF